MKNSLAGFKGRLGRRKNELVTLKIRLWKLSKLRNRRGNIEEKQTEPVGHHQKDQDTHCRRPRRRRERSRENI